MLRCFFTSYFLNATKSQDSLARGCHYGASLARTQQALQIIIFRGVTMRGIISFVTGALCACAGVIVTCAVSAPAREWVIHILGGGA